MKKLIATLLSAGLLGQSVFVSADQTPRIVATYAPAIGEKKLDLGTYTHPSGGKTLNLFGGAGSGSFRGSVDPANVIWTVGDRGPNFTCDEAVDVLGLTAKVACPAAPELGVAAGVGRIYPRPDYAPSIYKLSLQKNNLLKVLKVIPLRKADGTNINGLLNPHLSASAEIPRDGNGKVLAQGASVIDAEGLVRLPKFGGRFLLARRMPLGLWRLHRTDVS